MGGKNARAGNTRWLKKGERAYSAPQRNAAGKFSTPLSGPGGGRRRSVRREAPFRDYFERKGAGRPKGDDRSRRAKGGRGERGSMRERGKKTGNKLWWGWGRMSGGHGGRRDQNQVGCIFGACERSKRSSMGSSPFTKRQSTRPRGKGESQRATNAVASLTTNTVTLRASHGGAGEGA